MPKTAAGKILKHQLRRHGELERSIEIKRTEQARQVDASKEDTIRD